MSTLPKLISEANRIAEMLMESNGEITPEIEQALFVNEKDLAEKLDNYAIVLDRFEMEAQFLKEKAREIQAQAKALESARERLKENLKFAMRALKQDQVSGNEYSFKMTRSKPKLCIDAKCLPDVYKSQTVVFEPDRVKIQDALDMGIDVPGAKFEDVYALRKTVKRSE